MGHDVYKIKTLTADDVVQRVAIRYTNFSKMETPPADAKKDRNRTGGYIFTIIFCFAFADWSIRRKIECRGSVKFFLRRDAAESISAVSSDRELALIFLLLLSRPVSYEDGGQPQQKEYAQLLADGFRQHFSAPHR